MTSKYTKEERLEIGRQVYERHLNRHQAAVKYDVSVDTIREYMRLYKATLEMKGRAEAGDRLKLSYDDMSREELIAELKRLTGD